MILFIILMFIVALSGWFFAWYEHWSAYACAEIQEKERTFQLENAKEIALARASGLSQDVERSQAQLKKQEVRIKELESLLLLPLQTMPTGDLTRHHNRMVTRKLVDTDPTSTTPLPSMKLPEQLV